MSLLDPVDAVAARPEFDGVTKRLAALVGDLPRSVRDLLHGTWLGHPVHPAVVHLPIGAWLSATVLDVVAMTQDDPDERAGTESAASTLLAVGLASAPVAAAAGLADWADLHPEQQRIGAVHAGANGVAITVLAGSWLLRRSGHHALGRLVGLAGTGMAALSASIGGHLAYRWAAGANQAAHVARRTPPGWHYLARIEELPEKELWRRSIGDTTLVLLRRGEEVRALAATCSHCGGPLHEGRLIRKGGEECVVCPFDRSAFRFRDGQVVRGPATAPQPRFDVKIEGGAINARIAVTAM